MDWIARKIRLSESDADRQDEAAFVAGKCWTEWARETLIKAAEIEIENGRKNLSAPSGANNGAKR